MRPLGGVARARTAWAPFATAAAQRPAIPLFYNDLYEVPLPSKHRFPMRKYRLVRQGLERELTPQGFADFEPSPLVTLDDLVTTHCREYASRYVEGRMSVSENRRVGFPWSDASVRRSLSSTGGTVAAARAVCDGRSAIAGHIAGGTHHAFFDRGEGFCVFNDIAVAANVALRDYGTWLRRILVIDLDVHQVRGRRVRRGGGLGVGCGFKLGLGYQFE
jgi:acetoin utilization deacetylase AcuC-like enzyme